MLKIIPALIAALLAVPTSAQEPEILYAPDYTGVMTIRYLPIMCVRAPCPPGRYVIEGGEFTTRARTVIIEQDGEITQYTGQYLVFDKFIGGVWVGGENAVDILGIPLPDTVVSIQIAPHNQGGR